MTRSTLGTIMVLTLSAGACSTESTFTRTCYDVPHTVAEVRGDTVVTETGIRYIETFLGTEALVEECNDVSLRYTGELLDGTRFDEGSFTFVPGGGQVIAGFEQGVMGMRTGGIRRVIIPPELGYGDRPQHDPNTGDVLIPANSTILFDIEITNVVK